MNSGIGLMLKQERERQSIYGASPRIGVLNSAHMIAYMLFL